MNAAERGVDEVSSEPVVRQEEDAAARWRGLTTPCAVGRGRAQARAAFAASRGYDAVAERRAKVEEEDRGLLSRGAPQVAPQDAAAAAARARKPAGQR